MRSFSAQVGDWVAQSERRMSAVHKQSTQDVIEMAQTTVAKGGKMRVDTGFLRASGVASLDGLPFGETTPTTGITYSASDQDVTLVINQAGLGDTIYFGWLAEYARPREARDGFMRSAAQMWKVIVNRNVQRVQNV